MEYPDDLGAGGALAVKHKMGTDRKFAVAAADVVNGDAFPVAVGDLMTGFDNRADVALGLIDAPTAGAVVPNLVEINARGR